MDPTISVIIITYNEVKDIERCLASVQWANEIIVIDSGSTDGTQAICRQYTEKVFECDWPGYGVQKNRALAKATGEWILAIDADEEVSAELRDEIMQAIRSSRYQGYSLPRRSSYCGKWIRYGAWRSDKVIRLFKRQAGCFDAALVHETVIVNGIVGKLNSPLLHYTYTDFDEIIDKINIYSSASAKMRIHQQKPAASLTKAITHALWAFWRSYLIQLGFLDGREGFMLAVSNAEYVYYRYLKLMFLTRNFTKL